MTSSEAWGKLLGEDEGLATCLANRFGGSLSALTREDAEHADRQGLVVGLGQVRDEAGLYGALTGRSVVMIDDVSGLLEIGPVDVVVTTLASVSADLFDIVARIRPGFAPGLVFAPSELLARRCILSAACARAPISDNRRIEIVPDAGNLAEIGGFERIVSSEGTASLVRASMGSGAGLMCLETHSDGIDAKLSRHTALCARSVASPELWSVRPNRCHVEAFCHRLEEPLANDALPIGLIDIAEANCGVFLFDGCWSLYPPEGLIASYASVGAGIASNMSVLAAIGNWRATVRTPEMIAHLKRDIAAGRTLGEAVGSHNTSVLSRSLDHCLAILGDPLTRVHGLASAISTIEPGKKSSPTLSESLLGVGAVGEAKSVREIALHGSRLSSSQGNSVEATELVDVASGDPFVRKLLSLVPRTESVWLESARVVFIEDREHNCLDPAIGLHRASFYRAEFPNRPIPHRLLGLCQRCGICEDSDSAIAARVAIEWLPDHGLGLRVNGPTQGLRGFTFLKGQGVADRTWCEWARDSDGRLQPRAPLPGLTGKGVFYAGAVLAYRDSYSAFTFGFNSADLETRLGR